MAARATTSVPVLRCSQAALRQASPAAPSSAFIIERAETQRQKQAAGMLEARVDRRAAVGLVAAWIAGASSVNAVTGGNTVKPRKPKPLPSPGNPYGDEENGLWLPGLIPIPTVTNKINNPETGTRSFVQLGVYVANIGPEGSAYRIKHNAFDLLGWGDLLGRNAWSPLKKYLQLKSTIMYYDFDTVITAASEEQKQPLTDLANRLFSSFEKLEEAVKMKDDPRTRTRYDETTVVLNEVMERMAGA